MSMRGGNGAEEDSWEEKYNKLMSIQIEQNQQVVLMTNKIHKLRKALDLALYYVEGDSAFEICKAKIDEIIKEDWE